MGRDLDFVIVGGGIGGAVLAALLGRAGRRGIVLEKGTGHAVPRPEVLWPATVAKLSALIGADRLRDEAMVPLSALVFTRGDQRLATVTTEAFRRAAVQPCSTDPTKTRRLLLAHGSFDVRTGVEVREILRDGRRVVGVRAHDLASGRDLHFVARLTIGDDGAHSHVRRACGIGMALRQFPLDFLCFGLDWPAGLPAAEARLWINDARRRSRVGVLLVVPYPGRRGAGLVPLSPDAFEDPDALRDDWARFADQDPDLAAVAGRFRFPQDLVRVRREYGHAGRYGGEGAFLLGDAIHPVSPAGGQGANMSVADAAVLADVLLGNRADPLREYERRRRPANERSIAFTRAAAAALRARPPSPG